MMLLLRALWIAGLVAAIVWAATAVLSRGWPRTAARLIGASVTLGGRDAALYRIGIAYEYSLGGTVFRSGRWRFGSASFLRKETAERVIEKLRSAPLEVSVCPTFPGMATVEPGLPLQAALGLLAFFVLSGLALFGR